MTNTHSESNFRDREWKNDVYGVDYSLERISSETPQSLILRGFQEQPGEHWVTLPATAPSSRAKCRLFANPKTGEEIFIRT